ncbi:hypothetical protein E2C01_100722 [Portunus trituberculatus]|uniref:Uncharacterized protein n=1 Tax=Portunus trituberculatus TaxID=210409 RepID=A0A5B7KKA4_PORTR|nr:hypothetical protein [Portunus trituberculatus]
MLRSADVLHAVLRREWNALSQHESTPPDLSGDKDVWDEDTRDHSTTRQHETVARDLSGRCRWSKGRLGLNTTEGIEIGKIDQGINLST